MKKIFNYKNLFLLVISVLYFCTRFINTTRAMTVDENTWVARGYIFIKSIYKLDFNNTYQSSHPGVTVMYVSGLGQAVGRFFPEKLGEIYSSKSLRQVFFAKTSMYIFQTLLFSLFILLILKISKGYIWPLFFSLFIVFEPYVLGLSRMLHVDTLLSFPLGISLLSFVYFLRHHRKNTIYLYVSALFFGISFLTKTPSLFLIPFNLGLIIFDNILNKKKILSGLFDFAKWLILASLVVLLFWPKMWVQPLDAFKEMFTATSPDINKIHRLTELDPLFYPNTLISYLTPFFIITYALSLIFSIFNFFFNKKRDLTTIYLNLFVVGFIIAMSIFTKKGGRYIMPSIMMMAVLSSGLIENLFYKLNNKYIKTLVIFITSVFVISNIFTISKLNPYYLSYYSPLASVRYINRLGLGDGLDLAAEYLNLKPNARDLAVLAWYDSTFDKYFIGKTIAYDYKDTSDYDYVVTYRNMKDRPEEDKATIVLNMFKDKIPEKTIYINGLEYAWIYKNE